MSAALISNAVYCESCAADFLAFADCLGSVDTAFGTYDPIGNEFSGTCHPLGGQTEGQGSTGK